MKQIESTISKVQEKSPLMNLHLLDADWKQTRHFKPKKGKFLDMYEASPQRIEYKKTPLLLTGDQHHYYQDAGNKYDDADIMYIFLLSSSDANVEGTITFTPLSNEEFEASTCIIKNDPEKTLPKGVGIDFYKRLLDEISQYAQSKQISVRHVVVRETEVSDQPLKDQRWNEIFVPILEERGYEEDEDGVWVKEYRP